MRNSKSNIPRVFGIRMNGLIPQTYIQCGFRQEIELPVLSRNEVTVSNTVESLYQGHPWDHEKLTLLHFSHEKSLK